MQQADLTLENSSSSESSIQSKKLHYPVGIRCIVFSFMTVKELLDTVCKVSKKDRKQITKSEILDQPRHLKIILTD